MKYIFDIPDNVDYGVLTCRTSNGYYEYDFDGADLEKLPPAQPEQLGTNLAEVGTDCISRQAAIKATWQETGYTDPFNVMTAIRDRIKQLPPAQPERIKGHWIKISPANIYECSECGKSVMTNDICAYDFCHGCGADMREVTT